MIFSVHHLWYLVSHTLFAKNLKKEKKNNARTMYRHECEPVNPILIMLPMMQYWGGGLRWCNFCQLPFREGGRGIVCCQVSFCLGLGR